MGLRPRVAIGAAALFLLATAAFRTGPVTAQTPAATQAAAAASAAALKQYCVTCHNERLKSGGFVIDPALLTDVGASADGWEKVVRKLRTQSMPPPGAPRPDAAGYDRLATFLETELDRAEAARPHLGKLPLTHRLSRTEYRNAVRDLLALESLPREVSVDYLLPADNISSGFDNIADLLFISPSNLERYLDAARKISRLAVGDATMPVMVNIHQLDPEHPQDERVDELPFGTRGGIAIRSEFPVDGTYTVRVDVGNAQGHVLEITVDGERVALRALGGGRGTPTVGAPPGQPDPADPDPTPPSTARPAVQGRGDGAAAAAGARGGRAGGRGRGAAGPLEFPLTLKAGPKLIGVAFVQRTDARDESTLRQRMRSRGTQPAINSVTISGPTNVTGSGDSPSRRRIFICTPKTAAEELPCARRILSTLARRAYRRPATEADLKDLLPFYESGRRGPGPAAASDASAGGPGGSFDRGIQSALERLLVSSQFLFRIEREPASAPRASAGQAGDVFRISDLELASRLSFFIWSSIPDDELLDVAVAGRLKDPKVLEQQVRRMLADRRSESLVTNFAAQWLYLRDIAAKQPDEILFADFDETLRQAMLRETELFIGSIFRENRSVLDLISANYTFLNERLARHYGVPNIKGSYFRRVAFPDGSARGGLLGQGSVLTITSYSTRTSPVLRGKWVLENLLSAAPPPPPANLPSLKTDTAPGKPLTLREAMIQHRAAPACAGCHARMDPIGFAMENFDAVGRWRERDGEQAIDATGVFPEGTKFEGIPGLKRELLRQPEQFVGTVAERLLMYAIGRNLQYYDAPTVRAVMHEAAPAKYTLASLVLGIVKSRPFQMREAGGE